MTIFYIFFSVMFISLISLLGVVYLAISADKLHRLLLWLVSFAAGTLLGDVFFHLLPELVNEGEFSLQISLAILIGIFVFFVMEKVIFWRHCHIPTTDNHPHPLAAMNLIGDGMHNFLDGIIIAGSYLVSIPLGVATTVAVAFHEIPQEIGDFGILIHAGLTRAKAIFFNFLSALTAIIGALFAIYLSNFIENINSILVALTIGGFIYIATADLIPELKKDGRFIESIKQLGGILLGIGVMALFLLME